MKLDPKQVNAPKYYAPDQNRNDEDYRKLLRIPNVDAGNMFAAFEGRLSDNYEKRQQDKALAFNTYFPVLMQIYYNLQDEVERLNDEIKSLENSKQEKCLAEIMSSLEKYGLVSNPRDQFISRKYNV